MLTHLQQISVKKAVLHSLQLVILTSNDAVFVTVNAKIFLSRETMQLLPETKQSQTATTTTFGKYTLSQMVPLANDGEGPLVIGDDDGEQKRVVSNDNVK
jgi:hypothetical protein